MGSKRTAFGITLTLLYFLGFCLYISFNWPSEGLKLNEFGDMLAGFVGPVAFFWLVLGYLQQGEELKANGVALEAQAKELNRSVEEQRAQAVAIREQVAQDREYYQSMLLSNERQQRELTRSQQPLLSVASTTSSIGAGKLKTQIAVRNLGAPCTLIAAKMHTDIDVEVFEYGSRYVETGKSVEILHVTFEQRNVRGTISIFYLDTMQRQGRVNLRFTNGSDIGIKTIGDEADITSSDWGEALSRYIKG